ncbi:MAG: T9SS type A sorting domain-containing protein [Bacteroidales bacterium]|nr:T9SS type A sorting domain-containing protein [Bacteroidales bacterium]
MLSAASAQPVGKPMLSLVGEGDSLFRLRFEVQGSMPRVDSNASRAFCRLGWEGMAIGTGRVGCPDLPSLSVLVSLPKGSTLEVTGVRSTGTVSMDVVPQGRPLAPVTEGWVKDGLPPDYCPDAKVYGSGDLYRGGGRVEVELLGVMGAEQLFRVTVRPVGYRPVDGLLECDTSVDALLHVGKAASPSLGTHGYLVVSRPLFREGLQPFVRWKRQQGFEVMELYVDTHLRDSVKALMRPLWSADGSRGPRHVLLVGDVALLQAFPGTTHPTGLGNHVTDLYYAEFTGDYLPDALLGRWPVNDTAELGAVVRKCIRYEQGADIDTARLKRLLLVAGSEDRAPAPVTTNGQVDYVAREARLAHPFLDTLCYHNPASADQRPAILGDLRRGVALLNYTAHCTSAGWTSPSVTFTSIDTLDNPQPLLYVNNCCLSNAFDGTCFGEQLLRKADGGAIGVIGATNSTLWDEDYYWAVGPKLPLSLTPQYDSLRPGPFDRWLGRTGGVHSQGELLTAGNLAVTAVGSPYDKFYWETYCLLGDPSLEPWVGVPQPLELHLTNGQPTDGAGTLHLGGTPGCTVTAMQHDTVLGMGVMGPDGLLALQLGQSVDTSLLVLTATARHHRPRIDTLTVAAAEGTGVALREVTVGDSVVECRVENVGAVPLYGLRVVLSQIDADSAADALVAEQQTVVDTLLPHQSRRVAVPLQLVAVGQQPGWQAYLFAWDSIEGMLCCIRLQGRLEPRYPELSVRLLEADSSETNRLLPMHTYLLQTTVEGSCDSVSLGLTALPSGDTLSTFRSPLPTLHSPFSTPDDTLTHLHLQASVALGNHRRDYDWYMVGGQRADSFEEGFASYPWQQGGTQPWVVDSTVSHSGRFSVRSGAIDYRQTSDLVLEVLLPQRDTLSYWSRVSSEAQYDKLLFSVDGVRRGNERWGEAGWKCYTTVLDAGRHTLRWRYVKDESGSAGSDCAWIDDVRLPLALWDSAYGWFGDSTRLGIVQPGLPSLHVFPNPCNGTVTVDGGGQGELQVLDLYGRLCFSTRHVAPATYRFPSLPDGVYLLRLVTATGRAHQTLVIHH